MPNMTNENEVALSGLERISSDLIGPDDAARIVGVSLQTVRRWIQGKDGTKLPHTKLGGSIRIHRQSLVDFLNASAEGVRFYDPGFEPEEIGTLTDPDPAYDDFHY